VHGELAPGASTFIHYTFFGHSDISADVVAACKVEGGPTYELQFKGEASKMYYKFSQKTIDFGAVPYDQVHRAEIVLYNRGKVTFDFCIEDTKEDSSDISPGEIAVSPCEGCILAHDSVTFSVAFLPGIPEQFRKTFEIQVAHFEADVITLVGGAVFPQMTFNLPRIISMVEPSVQEQARANLDLLPRVQEASSGLSIARSMEEAIEIDRLLVKSFATGNTDKLFKPQAKLKPR
jgi:hydrocephalus-inducing protein